MKINISLTFNIKSERLKVKENILKMIVSVNKVDEEGFKPIFLFH